MTYSEDRIAAETARSVRARQTRGPQVGLGLGPQLCNGCGNKELAFRTSIGRLVCSYCGETIKEPPPKATLDTLAETLADIKKLLEAKNG